MTDRAPVGIAVAVFIAVGATISVGVGTYFLNGAQIEPMAWPDFLMGCFAFAVLGGIWGFAVGGFVCIGYRAVRHAIQQSNRPDE